MPVKNVTQRSKLKFYTMVHFLTLSLSLVVSSQVSGVLRMQFNHFLSHANSKLDTTTLIPNKLGYFVKQKQNRILANVFGYPVENSKQTVFDVLPHQLRWYLYCEFDANNMFQTS